MANQEHIAILKQSITTLQGITTWNQWRKKHANIRPDLSHTDLRDTPLESLDFSYADLSYADLSYAVLMNANLDHADLSDADLNSANLSSANLSYANLSYTDFSSANLSYANFSYTFLRYTFLRAADLSHANLINAFIKKAEAIDADLSFSEVGLTTFGDIDLSVVKGLETLVHRGGSTVGIDTIIRSHGNISDIFLRKAGVPDSIIQMIPSLIGSLRPIDFYSCFISYSSKDQDFVTRLYADLQNRGVRCWFSHEDMKIGDKIRPRIEESIHQYDKLLLVLSEHSIASNWVAYEVERALNKEPEGVPNVLYPIRLDDAVMEYQAEWLDDVRRTRHIGDFTQWKNHDAYQKAFNRLLRALKSETSRRL